MMEKSSHPSGVMKRIRSRATNRPNRKPSHAEIGKEMGRKVASFDGEVIAPFWGNEEEQ